jgi:hypothetical protein
MEAMALIIISIIIIIITNLHLKDLVLGQSKINESIYKSYLPMTRFLKNLSAKMDDFASTIENQLSFNKMLETQLAQLAATVPSFEQR